MKRLNGEAINYSDEELWQRQVERERYDAAVASYAGAPRLFNDETLQIYRQLNLIEDRLVPDGDYVIGSARVDDEVLVVNGLATVLLTAEHATEHVRDGAFKEADRGTGALGCLLAEELAATALIAVGRQTSDANYQSPHPLKKAMEPVITADENRAHLSLHMLDRGRASHPLDRRGYSVMLGIGRQPSEATLALKDYMLLAGDDLDLKVGVNAPHVNFDEDGRLRVDQSGEVKTVTFAGAGQNTTRTFSQNVASSLGKNDSYAAVQLEINEVLLVRHNDEIESRGEGNRELGAYLGYLFVKQAIEAVNRL